MDILRKLPLPFFALILLFAILSATAQEKSDYVDFSTAAHHGLLNSKGVSVSPDAKQIAAWVERNYEAVSSRANKQTLAEVAALRDELLANKTLEGTALTSVLLDALLEKSDGQKPVKIIAINRVLREYWYKDLIERDPNGFDWASSLPLDIAKSPSVAKALAIAPGSLTTREYIKDCEKAGVPAPETWKRGGSEWKFEGPLLRNFLNLGEFTEVWTFEDESPDGICISLPRYSSDPNKVSDASASAVGIICLGRDTGNACYYDTGNVKANSSRALKDFLNGSNVTNGVCSDCHAGENPFIAHLQGPLDLGARSRSPKWHEPLIRSDYPQNPGPLTLLDSVSLPAGQQSCLGCHNSGYAGRFPDILALNLHSFNRGDGPISDYCSAILTSAMNGFFDGFQGVMVAPTMARIPDPADPGNVRKGTKDPDYQVHRLALATLCANGAVPPPETVPFDPKDDPGVISPPVIGPIYACSEWVEVRGGIYDATVAVEVNGAVVANETVKQPNGFSVKVPSLNVGDTVRASQTFAGVTASSATVTVTSHLDDYPSGLPAPEIDPTIAHACGVVIAVRHVPGVKLSVFSNGADERSFSLGGTWTNLKPYKSPFAQGDQFTAQQHLCADSSSLSNVVTVGPEPSPLPVPQIKGGAPIQGQPLLHVENLPEGARTEVAENSAGVLAKFATAVTWNPEVDVATGLGRNILAGDQFTIMSSLCEKVKVETEPTRPCEKLPAPTIAQPLVGDTTVKVTSYVAGAQIQIYDNSGIEIADGSGDEIGLTRPIAVGDILTVVQRLGDCVSREAYRIHAICLDPELCK